MGAMTGGRFGLSARRFLRGWQGDMGTNQLAFLLNLPTLLVILLIIAYPLGYAFHLSVHDVTLRGLRSGYNPYVGLENYKTVLSEPLFLRTLVRTILFAVVAVVCELALGLLVAMAMGMDHVWISRVTRLVALMPWAVPPVASGLMWSFIYNSKYGHLNAVLYTLGLIDSFVPIVSHPISAILGVLWAYAWRVTPFCALLFHAALQGIPQELYEAAEVDGANPWQQFWKITLPLLRPVTTVQLILRTAFAIMIFAEVFAITGGGPGDSTWTAAWYSYWTTFKLAQFDIGAASAFILTVVIACFTIFYIKFVYQRIQL